MTGNKGPRTQAVSIAMTAVAATTLGLRFYVRAYLVRKVGREDGFMLIAFVGLVMFATCIIGSIHYGGGQHMKELTKNDASKALKYLWVAEIGYGFGATAVRISIGLFLLRFIVSSIQKWIIYVTIALSSIVSLVVTLLVLVECHPVDLFWDPDRTASCNSSKPAVVISIVGALVAILCDFSLSITPMVLVWGLNLKRLTKIALMPIFGLGCCASIGAVLEIITLAKLRADDFTYNIMDLALWSHVELGLAIMAGNLVTTRPLYRHVGAKLGFGSASLVFFKVKTPRWTNLFTRGHAQRDSNAAPVVTTIRPQSATHESGQSDTLTGSGSKSRENPKPSNRQIHRLPDLERQQDSNCFAR